MWLKVLGVDDTATLFADMRKHAVACVPGAFFMNQPDDTSAPRKKSSHFRVAFCFASEEKLVEGCQRLGAMLRARADADKATAGPK